MKVLIADNLPEECIEILERSNIKVEFKPTISQEGLKNEIGNYEAIIIRSKTKINAEILERANRLKIICRAGVGIDNVDVVKATKKGIVVMNAPVGNIVSTAEHTIALLLALSRNIVEANRSLRAGEWERTRFIGSQVSGKTLGIIGMGRVGRLVAKRAAALEMKVIGYDPFITTDIASAYHTHMTRDLTDLLKQSDYITIHVPLNADTKGLITRREFGLMKDNVRIINCARGGIVLENDLYEAIINGKVGGAALDVFEIEPPVNNKLILLDKVLTTPHLAASTFEAQLEVAKEAAEQVADGLNGKGFRNALNIPSVDTEELKQLQPYLTLAEKMGAFLMQLIQGSVQRVEIIYNGEVSNRDVRLISDSFMVGIFRPTLEEGVNLVSIPLLVKERGITINETTSNVAKDFTNLITTHVLTDKGECRVSGTVFDKKKVRIVNVNGYEIESSLEKDMLVLFCKDRAGLIGNIGMLLAKKGINIAHMTFGRKERSGDAIAVLDIDASITEKTLEEIKALDDINSAHLIKME